MIFPIDAARRGPRPHSALSVAILLLAGAAPLPATANQEDHVKFVVGGSIRNESNVFRRPAGFAVADTISTGFAGLRIDKPYAQQRVQFDITETRTRYEEFSRLDFDALDYRALWLWRAGPRLNGVLSAIRSEALVPFQDTRSSTQRNVQTNENRTFTADWWAGGGWHITGGITRIAVQSEAPADVVVQPDFSSIGIEAGIRHDFSSGNQIAVSRRMTRGDYQDAVALASSSADFRENETAIRTTWKHSAISTFSARLARRERHSQTAVPRDFSGLSGDLTYTWTPTGKFVMTLLTSRNETAVLDPSFSYVLTTTYSAASTWKISEKTSVKASLIRADSGYRGSGPVAATVPPREEVQDTAEIGLTWIPVRGVTLGATVKRQQRSSNVELSNFKGTTAILNASLSF